MNLNTDSKDQFARSIIRALQDRGETRELTFDRDQFSIFVGDRDNQLYLGNVYEECLGASPARMAEVMEPYLAGVNMSAADMLPNKVWAEAKADLRVHVRKRVRYESFGSLQGPSKPAGDLQLITTDLCIVPVFDRAYTIADVDEEQLATWGITMTEAIEAGMENLRRLSREPFTKIGKGTYLSPWDDSYDATRLVFPELIEKLPVNGDHVAVVPSRNSLIVTGSDDTAGLMLAAEHLKDKFGKVRNISGRAYRLKDGKWKWFLPPKTHPAHHTLAECAKLMLLREYSIQQPRLQETQETFVASVICGRTGTGAVKTFSCVGDAGSLIPPTDCVAFVSISPSYSAAAIQAVLSWERVLELFAHRIKRLDIYPERYHVIFPTREELDALDPQETDPANWKSYFA